MPATRSPRKLKRKPVREGTKPVLLEIPEPVPQPVLRQVEEGLKGGETPAGGPDISNFLWRHRVAPALLLALLTFALYVQVLHHPFVNYDDAEYISDNTNIQHGVNWAMLRWAMASTEHANWHPVTWLSHALDWQLFGSHPLGHHLTSLLLHVANVVLLFLFFAGVTNSTARSLLIAALFAVHPLCVETIAWVSERKNVLCTTLFLLAMMVYARYARRPNIGRYLAVTLLFALALASKPMVVTLPFVLMLLDYWPLQRIKGWSQPSVDFHAPQFPAWRLALEKLPLLVLSVADGVVTVIAQQKVHAIRSGAAYPLWLRVENAIFSYAAYLWRTVFPVHLAVLYPYPSGGLPLLRVILSALLLITITVLALHERRRPYLLTGWLWFLGMFVPVIGLVQVGEQGMADRYAYLPLIGMLLFLVWGGFDLVQMASSRVRWLTGAAAGTVLVVFAFLSVRQLGFWKSNLDLWSHAVAVTKNNGVAEDVVGSELLTDAMNRGLRYSDEARVHFENAARINPQDSEALMNIGAGLQVQGRLQEAIEKYKLALQYVNDEWLRARIVRDMASAYEERGDFATARSYYQQAMQISPKADNAAFFGFARTFTDEKIVALGAKLASNPTAKGYFDLGQLQDAGGYTAAAESSYQRALALDSHLEEARAALAHDSSLPH
jgi:protein O-mannosyl-transferase